MAIAKGKGPEAANSVYGSSTGSMAMGWGAEDDAGMTQTEYGSILFQLKEAEDESTDLLHFVQRCLEVFWDSLVVTAVLILLLVMPIAMLTVGTSYQHECPLEPRLPIYLQVGGAFGFLLLVLLLWQQYRWRRAKEPDADDDDDDLDDLDDGMLARSCRFTCHVVALFLLAWFVMGNVWLWSLGQPQHFEQPLHEPLNWCNEVLYLFTLYQLLVVYALLGVVLLGFCCTFLIYGLRRRGCCCSRR